MSPTALSLACLVLVAGGAAPASAGGLPRPASELEPPRYIDETQTELFVLNRGGGYLFSLRSALHGPTSDSDALRIDLVQRGRILASQRCPLGSALGDAGVPFQCDQAGAPIQAVGPVTANVIYLEDGEEEHLLRQLHVTVAVFPWRTERRYQVLQDDMLGTAFATLHTEDPTYPGTGDHQIVFSFWTTGAPVDNPVLGCAVDGARLADEKTFLVGATGPIEVDMLAGRETRVYRWTPWRVTPERLLWGTLEEVQTRRGWMSKDQARAKGHRFLADHPGAWACDVRVAGRVIRQLRFQVSAEGRVVPSDAQRADGFPRLPPGVVHVDMRIPATGHGETRFRPQAIRRSMRYGMPWPEHPMLDAFKRSLPPPSGLPDPGGR